MTYLDGKATYPIVTGAGPFDAQVVFEFAKIPNVQKESPLRDFLSLVRKRMVTRYPNSLITEQMHKLYSNTSKNLSVSDLSPP